MKVITFQQKLHILKYLEAGKPRQEICERFNCCKSTIRRVMLAKQTLLQLAKRDREGMVTHTEIDASLSKWAHEMKQNNNTITANAVKEKAEEIARQIDKEFSPSAKWLYNWKERENVEFQGGDEMLKGLLEKGEGEDLTQPPRKKFKASTGHEEDIRYTADSPTRNENSHDISDPIGDCNSPTAAVKKESNARVLRPSPKKVPYSFDTSYVLTSSGRYRKEKTFLTLLQKLEIIQRLKNGEKRNDLINEYRLSQSAMSAIVADEKKIMKLAAFGQNLQMKRVRGGIFKDGEKELNTWVLKKIDEGETLTRTQVKTKAKEIAERLNIDFKASSGWLEKWKARMNMDFNESQILHRKIPSYISTTDDEMHISDETYVPENIFGDEDEGHEGHDSHEDQDEEKDDVKKALAETEVYTFDNGQQTIYDITEVDSDDVKPVISTTTTPSPVVTRVSTPVQERRVSTDNLHQKILNWLSKHKIGPTATIELLTILHPVIAETSDNP